MLSIVIPTLNEEEYLPRVLRDLRNQTYRDYEIIIADAGSTDRTLDIARHSGCSVTKGGLPGKGRNEGAKKAKGDLILFLDADVRLSGKSFLKEALKEFRSRRLSAATCLFSSMGRSEMFPQEVTRSWFTFVNYLMLAAERIAPFGVGSLIFVKTSVHKAVGGFDEDVQFSEDVLYIRKIAKKYRFRILRKVRLHWSLRRFDKEKWVKPLFLYILASFVMHFDKRHLKIFNNGPLEYKFGHYKELDRLALQKNQSPRKIKELGRKIRNLVSSLE